jgi:site-specific DNA recombinase
MITDVLKINKLISIYARVSTSNQENEGTIETQLSSVKEFASRNGYTIVQEYIDNGWSGDSIIRPALDQLRMDAKKKIWEAVLIYDPDRLARRYSYQELVMDELREAGIEVMFVTTPAPKSGVEKILYGVQGLFAEYERAKIAERFRLGKVRKAKEGHILTTEAPYGYIFITKKGKRGDADFCQGHYVINEEEARVVKKIFSWVADEGLTLRKVVKRLQELKIAPQRSKRGVWATSTLSHMFANKTYIGEGHYGSSYAIVPERPHKKEGYKKVKKTSRRMRPEEEWIKIPTLKIIDEELFFRAQKALKDNFALCSRNTKNQYLLSGRIWCDCGKRRTGEGPQHGKHLYYRCSDRTTSFPLPALCHAKGINARIADRLVWSKIATLMTSPDLLHKQIERWIKSKQNKVSFSAGDEVALQKEVSKLKEQEDRYNKAYGSGVFSIEQLREYVEPIKEKISSLQIQISNIKVEMEQTETSLPNQDEVRSFAEKVKDKIENLSFEVKKGIIMNIVDKIVGSKECLQVCGNIPITINNYVDPFTSNRNSGFTKCREKYLVQCANQKKRSV